MLEGRVSSPAVSILAACGSVCCGVLDYRCDIVGGGAGSIWSGRVCIGSGMLYLRHLVPDVVNFAMVLEVFFVEVVV